MTNNSSTGKIMKDKVIDISIVSPVYGTPELVHQLCDRLHESIRCITENYEVVLVFDCSRDDGWLHICRECEKDNRVKGIKLSRNFGQHYAIMAGLEYVKGEWVVVMDCDLQDRPEEIPVLFDKVNEGFDMVLAQRRDRRELFLKRLSSKLFYMFLAT